MTKEPITLLSSRSRKYSWEYIENLFAMIIIATTMILLINNFSISYYFIVLNAIIALSILYKKYIRIIFLTIWFLPINVIISSINKFRFQSRFNLKMIIKYTVSDIQPDEIAHLFQLYTENKKFYNKNQSDILKKINKNLEILDKDLKELHGRLKNIKELKDNISNEGKYDIDNRNTALSKTIKFMVQANIFKLDFDIEKYDNLDEERERFYDIITNIVYLNRDSFTESFCKVYFSRNDYNLILQSTKSTITKEVNINYQLAMLQLIKELDKHGFFNKEWEINDIAHLFYCIFMILYPKRPTPIIPIEDEKQIERFKSLIQIIKSQNLIFKS